MTIESTVKLGIEKTKFRRASEFKAAGRKTDRLLDILKKAGATHYISGAAAKDYIEEEKFRKIGIELEYMVYDYPEYEQLHPPFDGAVSILDLLLMKGADAGKYIWKTKF